MVGKESAVGCKPLAYATSEGRAWEALHERPGSNARLGTAPPVPEPSLVEKPTFVTADFIEDALGGAHPRYWAPSFPANAAPAAAGL
jgi:hypothetical protein